MSFGQGAGAMTKFFSLIASIVVCAPFAYVTLAQAAQIVA
jgi:hypothetical protein